MFKREVEKPLSYYGKDSITGKEKNTEKEEFEKRKKTENIKKPTESNLIIEKGKLAERKEGVPIQPIELPEEQKEPAIVGDYFARKREERWAERDARKQEAEDNTKEERQFFKEHVLETIAEIENLLPKDDKDFQKWFRSAKEKIQSENSTIETRGGIAAAVALDTLLRNKLAQTQDKKRRSNLVRALGLAGLLFVGANFMDSVIDPKIDLGVIATAEASPTPDQLETIDEAIDKAENLNYPELNWDEQTIRDIMKQENFQHATIVRRAQEYLHIDLSDDELKREFGIDVEGLSEGERGELDLLKNLDSSKEKDREKIALLAGRLNRSKAIQAAFNKIVDRLGDSRISKIDEDGLLGHSTFDNTLRQRMNPSIDRLYTGTDSNWGRWQNVEHFRRVLFSVWTEDQVRQVSNKIEQGDILRSELNFAPENATAKEYQQELIESLENDLDEEAVIKALKTSKYNLKNMSETDYKNSEFYKQYQETAKWHIKKLTKLKQELNQATAPEAKQEVLEKAKRLFVVNFRLTDSFFRGTDWSMQGMSPVPGRGSVACGRYPYLIARNAGWHIARPPIRRGAWQETTNIQPSLYNGQGGRGVRGIYLSDIKAKNKHLQKYIASDALGSAFHVVGEAGHMHIQGPAFEKDDPADANSFAELLELDSFKGAAIYESCINNVACEPIGDFKNRWGTKDTFDSGNILRNDLIEAWVKNPHLKWLIDNGVVSQQEVDSIQSQPGLTASR